MTHRAGRMAAVLLSLGILASCVVDKAALAKKVELQNVDLRSVPDGVYEGAYTIQTPPGVAAANKSANVRVTVSGGRYTKLEILKPQNLGTDKSFQGWLSGVKESQTLSVDAVSGATITKIAVLKAIEEAVRPASKAP